MNEGLRHCFDCGKDFIEEEWWAHPCVEAKRPVKDITIDYSYETTEEDGSRTIHAYGLNGNIYRLNLPTPAKLAELKKAEPDESKQGQQTDYSEWLRRRGNSSSGMVLVTPRESRPWSFREFTFGDDGQSWEVFSAFFTLGSANPFQFRTPTPPAF